MAIEVFSEISSAGISPRISFSYNINNAEVVEEHHHHHRRLDTSLLDSDSDFHFSFGNVDRFPQELSAADELFSNGKILPIGIKKESVVAKQVPRRPVTVPSPTQTFTGHTVKKRLKEFLSMSVDDEDDHKPAFKSFWQFKRCSSESSTRSKSLIRSLDQFLSRNKSTGSVPNPKPTIASKEIQKMSYLSRKSSMSSSSSSGAFYTYRMVCKLQIEEKIELKEIEEKIELKRTVVRFLTERDHFK